MELTQFWRCGYQTKGKECIDRVFLILYQVLGCLGSMVGTGDAEMCGKIGPKIDNHTKENHWTGTVAVLGGILSTNVDRVYCKYVMFLVSSHWMSIGEA